MKVAIDEEGSCSAEGSCSEEDAPFLEIQIWNIIYVSLVKQVPLNVVSSTWKINEFELVQNLRAESLFLLLEWISLNALFCTSSLTCGRSFLKISEVETVQILKTESLFLLFEQIPVNVLCFSISFKRENVCQLLKGWHPRWTNFAIFYSSF